MILQNASSLDLNKANQDTILLFFTFRYFFRAFAIILNKIMQDNSNTPNRSWQLVIFVKLETFLHNFDAGCAYDPETVPRPAT